MSCALPKYFNIDTVTLTFATNIACGSEFSHGSCFLVQYSTADGDCSRYDCGAFEYEMTRKYPSAMGNVIPKE
jgi:hypothetical protein